MVREVEGPGQGDAEVGDSEGKASQRLHAATCRGCGEVFEALSKGASMNAVKAHKVDCSAAVSQGGIALPQVDALRRCLSSQPSLSKYPLKVAEICDLAARTPAVLADRSGNSLRWLLTRLNAPWDVVEPCILATLGPEASGFSPGPVYPSPGGSGAGPGYPGYGHPTYPYPQPEAPMTRDDVVEIVANAVVTTERANSVKDDVVSRAEANLQAEVEKLRSEIGLQKMISEALGPLESELRSLRESTRAAELTRGQRSPTDNETYLEFAEKAGDQMVRVVDGAVSRIETLLRPSITLSTYNNLRQAGYSHVEAVAAMEGPTIPRDQQPKSAQKWFKSDSDEASPAQPPGSPNRLVVKRVGSGADGR